MQELPLRLNCTRCHAFTEYEPEKSHRVAVCQQCGKRHSKDSLWVVKSDKQYERTEGGMLMELPP